MESFLTAVNSVVWGLPMLLFFMFTAIRFTLKSRFYQIRGIKTSTGVFINSLTKKNNNGISQFSAFCSVLGACIGTGNIVGIATAIYSGGSGSVFWMIISALFSMMTAYAENYLGAEYSERYRFQKNCVGAVCYIKNGLNMSGLSKAYAFLCMMSVFGMGNMTQSNSLCDAVAVTFNIPKVITALVISIAAFTIIRGGIKSIAKFQTLIIPVATIFYLIISFAVLFKYKENILPVIRLILTEAFSVKALSGFGMYKAIRYGISRGVFSNEAGLGSSTIIHSQSQNSSGKVQGISAMAEVFIDTIFMCTVTSLVILVSTNESTANLYGAQLSAYAYSTIGIIGRLGVGILTAVFAFTSLTACSFYGEKSFQHISGKANTTFFKFIYAIFIFIGGVFSPKLIWELADICNGLMAIPNLFALNCLQKEVDFPD